MTLLNHLFGSSESTAKEIELDDENIIKIWTDYQKTFSEKEKLITGLLNDHPIERLELLKKTICAGLIDITAEEKIEEDLIKDLESIEHSKKIRRVKRLEECLGYAETKYEYLHELLKHLHDVLKSEAHLITNILKGSANTDKMITHLVKQFEIEQEIVRRIGAFKTFHQLFLDLIKGEHLIRKLDSHEKKLLEKMKKGMGQILSNDKKDGVTYEWTMTVYEDIEDTVHEAVAKGMFEGYHESIDFEFVNRNEFIELVKDCLTKVRARNVSEQMLNAFVHMFREWYNHERD